MSLNFNNSPKETEEDLDKNFIDENKLQEFDQEVSNYLDMYNEDKFFKNNKEIEYNYAEENERLVKKIEEYQKLNREWETKVYNIKKVLTELEERNNLLKEQNEKLKDENEQITFKLKLCSEKEKQHEMNFKNLKELQNEYDVKTNELKKEYRLKEDNLKRKFEKLEEMVNKKLQDQEEEYNDKVERLENQIQELKKEKKNLMKECDELKTNLEQTVNFYQMKEEEFSDLVVNKDKKLKELELCIKSISDEANGQINKLSESVSEFNEKINFYKNRELQITQEYLNLKKMLKQNNQNYSDVNILQLENRNENKNDNYDSNNSNQNLENNRKKSMSQENVTDLSSKSKTIEILRNKIKELEEENMYISRELNLKYEECETLNDELRLAYETIKNSEYNAQIILKEKEDEVTNLTNKINELDIIISKYGHNLTNIKKSYEKNHYDHQMEILNKNNELKKMQDSYERKIRELQNNIEMILLKETAFTQSMNTNNHSLQDKNQYIYVPKVIPDDEEVRRNINDQINFIKEKLERTYYA